MGMDTDSDMGHGMTNVDKVWMERAHFVIQRQLR